MVNSEHFMEIYARGAAMFEVIKRVKELIFFISFLLPVATVGTFRDYCEKSRDSHQPRLLWCPIGLM